MIREYYIQVNKAVVKIVYINVKHLQNVGERVVGYYFVQSILGLKLA